MGFIRRFIYDWFSNQQLKEISQYIGLLESSDSDEIGLLLAGATHFRNDMILKGYDLLEPHICLARNSGLIVELSRLVGQLQRRGRQIDAAPIIIWVHTLRAIAHPELRVFGRKLWRELSRGFPHVETKAEFYERNLNIVFDIDGYDQFPRGLSPEPL